MTSATPPQDVSRITFSAFLLVVAGVGISFVPWLDAPGYGALEHAVQRAGAALMPPMYLPLLVVAAAALFAAARLPHWSKRPTQALSLAVCLLLAADALLLANGMVLVGARTPFLHNGEQFEPATWLWVSMTSHVAATTVVTRALRRAARAQDFAQEHEHAFD